MLTKELYEQLRDCPYVADIEYRKCQHFVYPANLTLARNGAAIVLDDLLLVNGFAGFPEDTPLVSGVLPAQPDECVVESTSSQERTGLLLVIICEMNFCLFSTVCQR